MSCLVGNFGNNTPVCWYTHTQQEALASFLPPPKCKQLVKLDCQTCFSLLQFTKRNLPKLHTIQEKNKWEEWVKGRFFSQLLPSTCWKSDAPKQMCCLSNIQETLVFELLKSEPSTFQNRSELLWLLRIAQLPCLLCWAAGPWAVVVGLHGEALVVGGLQGWLLWEAARSFPHVWESQCQLALRRTCWWPRPSPSAMVATPLG